MTLPSGPPEFPSGGATPPIQTQPIEIDEDYAIRLEPYSSNILGAIRLLISQGDGVTSEFKNALEWSRSNLGSNRGGLVENRRSARQWFHKIASEASDIFDFIPLWENISLGYQDAVERRLASSGAEGYAVLVRIQRALFWVRDDEIVQIAPGATLTTTSKAEVGLTTSQTSALEMSIGYHVGLGNQNQFNSGVTRKYSQTVSQTSKREVSQQLVLSNDRSDANRLFALWRRGYRIHTDILTCDGDGTNLMWRPDCDVRYISDTSVTQTSIVAPVKRNGWESLG